jgi:hypothetical protein
MTPLSELSSTVRFGIASLLAGLICLATPCAIRAQGKAKAKAADKTAEADLKFKEAEVLREAYIVLAAANHDYNGHRAKAMNQIQSAVKILDQAVAKNGSAKTKAATSYEDAVAAAAKRAAKGAPTIHEAQTVSDAQLKKAAAGLAELRPLLVQHNQKTCLATSTMPSKNSASRSRFAE